MAKDRESGNTQPIDAVQELEKVQAGKPIDKAFFKEKIEGRLVRATKLEKIECWPEVQAMIENGIPVREIVHYIQEERNEYKEVTHDSLRTILYRWIHDHSKEYVNDRVPTRHFNLIKSTAERVDPLDAVNMLFAIHMDRIMMDYETEKKIGKCLNANTLSMKLANEMIKTINEVQGDVLMYRLRSGQPKSPTETLDQVEKVKQAYIARFGRTAAMVAMTPDSRRRVLNALQKLRGGNSEAILKILQAKAESKGE